MLQEDGGGWVGTGGKKGVHCWGNCAEGGCEPEPEARPLQGSVAGRETQQVHPSHAHSLSHHWLLAFLGRITFPFSRHHLSFKLGRVCIGGGLSTLSLSGGGRVRGRGGICQPAE